jgi:L-asparaginase II
MKSEIIAKVTRGGTLESVHRGTLIVIEGDGNKVAEIGDSSAVTFWRSAAKAFQAVPFLTSGAAAGYGFSDKEIALACASHSGEPFHIELVKQMLVRSGSDETTLRCGAHLPMHEESMHKLLRAGEKENQLHNNCSGKHSAMIAFAKHIGADPDTYLSQDSPVQKAILETVSLFTEVPIDEIKIGIDGCSAPNFAVPLSSMALAYAKLINPEEFFARETHENTRNKEKENNKVSLIEACRRIVSAKMKYPQYVGGSVRLDTRIMKALPGKIVCKVGAEGVWSAGILPCEKWPKGLAIALKIEDGNDYRARPVVAVELLKKLGVLDEKATEDLREFAPMILKNRMEKDVGEVVADFEIKI